MQYTFLMSIKELKSDGYDPSIIQRFYKRARELCNKKELFVTLNRKLPDLKENLAAYVSDIHLSVRKDYIFIKVESFTSTVKGVLTDGSELFEDLAHYIEYIPEFAQGGDYITLIKQPPNWKHVRSYVVDI